MWNVMDVIREMRPGTSIVRDADGWEFIKCKADDDTISELSLFDCEEGVIVHASHIIDYKIVQVEFEAAYTVL